jgi:murein DD-endopeptidase MepM/ murein hydrolase activator NlpD
VVLAGGLLPGHRGLMDHRGTSPLPYQRPPTLRRAVSAVVLVLVTGLVLAASLALTLALLAPVPARADAGPWTWPLAPEPRVSRGFDPPAQPWLGGHRGVDLLGTAGASVRAGGAGRVSYAGRLVDRGVVVVVHGALRTTYEPVEPTVSVGTTVAAGDVVGTLAGDGGHCTPRACLHWGLRRGETYLDPLLLVRRGPARLLPVWSATATAVREGSPARTAASSPVEEADATHAPSRDAGGPVTAGTALATGAATAAALLASRRITPP